MPEKSEDLNLRNMPEGKKFFLFGLNFALWIVKIKF